MLPVFYFVYFFIAGRFDGGKDNQIEWQAVDQDGCDEPTSTQHPAASFPVDAGPLTPLNMTRTDFEENGEEEGTNDQPASGSDDDIYYQSTENEFFQNPMDSFSRASHSADYAKSLYRQSDSINSVLSKWTNVDGSQTNLGFTDSESGASSASSGWTWHQTNARSKSFIDRTRRFVRRSRERLSLIELNRQKLQEDGPRFLRLHDPEAPKKRSSLIDDPVSSQIVLPQRPASALFDGRRAPPSESNSLRTRYDSSSQCMMTGRLRFQQDDHINIFILPYIVGFAFSSLSLASFLLLTP